MDRRAGAIFGVLIAVAAWIAPLAAQKAPIRQQSRHAIGQTVAPIFEGWVKLPNGTFDLYFSYMNRNYEEELDIPIGPNNRFEPGEIDRGQPTHFMPRHNRMVFAINVPADFGKGTVTWTLTTRGNTEKVTGSLNPLWVVDPFIGPPGYGSNKPPVVTLDLAPRRVTLRAGLDLSAGVTDDGIPNLKSFPPTGLRDDKVAREFEGPQLIAEWSKYRGPGNVAFAPSAQVVTNGTAATKATFDTPGEYVLQLVVDDGSEVEGFQCCWTNRKIRVTVDGAGVSAPKPKE